VVALTMVSQQQWTATQQRDHDDLELARIIASGRNTVFVALDVKWDETDSGNVLEIGVAVLDIRKGRLKPARFPPSTWSIRSRHYIITENVHIRNTVHTRSNPFLYIFGKSYFARLPKAIQSIQAVFKQYPSVTLVGHFLSRDRSILESVGLDVSMCTHSFDISNLGRVFKGVPRRRALEDMIEDMEINYYHPNKLGNSGNEAFYIMAIFARMVCLP
jgi:hypothetical protein